MPLTRASARRKTQRNKQHMPRGVMRRSLSSPLSSSLSFLSPSQHFHNHYCTFLLVLYPPQCAHHRTYATQAQVAPVPRSMYYKGLANALSKPQQPSSPTDTPPHRKRYVENSNITEVASPAETARMLLSKHYKGSPITPNEVLKLIPLVDSASATTLYKISKEQGYFKSEMAVSFYNSLIAAHGKHKNIEESLRLFEEMTTSKVQPNVATYNSLMGIFAHNNRLEEALALFHAMAQNGVEPNERSYAVLLNTYSKRLDLPNVKAILRDMLDKGVSPGAPIYTMLIEMQLALNNEAEALEILDKMKKGLPQQQPDVVTWAIFMAHYEKIGNLEKMREMFDLVLKDKENLKAFPFSLLIRGYNNKGLFKEAISIFDLAKQNNVRLSENLLNSTLHSYSMLGDFIGTMAVRRIMAARYLKFDTLGMNALMRCWLKEKMYPKVYSMLNDMEHYKISKDEITHSLTLDLYIREKLFAKVDKELELMKASGIPLTTITFEVLAKHYTTPDIEAMLQRTGHTSNNAENQPNTEPIVETK